MKILALEDDPARIRWLQRHLQVAEIWWADRVPDFLAMAERYAPFDLVLMDHDLHRWHDGRAAARRLQTSAPIVVWSANPWGGPEMAEIMRSRGLKVLAQLPFGHPELGPLLRAL